MIEPGRQIRLLVADDHAIVRAGLVSILNQFSEFQVVVDSATGRDAVEAWELHRPDVALVDLRMPELDGVEVTAALRRRDPNAAVVILTSFDGDHDVSRGLAAGAKAYLLKDSTPDELCDCIHTVMRGESYVTHSLRGRIVALEKGDQLTQREREVLVELGRGFSNADIAAALGIGEGTVKLHMKSILSKLDASSRAEAIVIAIKRGHLHP